MRILEICECQNVLIYSDMKYSDYSGLEFIYFFNKSKVDSWPWIIQGYIQLTAKKW